ncbi:MAG: class I SAM-dependent methyltransferase [Thiotrichales bacterium]
MWNQIYSTDDYAYGTDPNAFLCAVNARLPRGRTLCIGEGEGRNAVYLAQQGHRVTAVDASEVGLGKASRLAEARGVALDIVVADLAQFPLGHACWDCVVSIFCHLPPPMRATVHRSLVAALAPGGILVLEAYTPGQLDFRTGGPPVAELMMDLKQLRDELAGLHFAHALELEREVYEGRMHHGRSAVVQILAVKAVASDA